MATPRSAWGIDIGQCALKAVKLRLLEGEALAVEAFDVIEHATMLSAPEADRKQLIHTALEQFLARNNVSKSAVAVSVPGQTSFTRFVKLPPVEPKRIPEIVRFEATQQIPFPIEDVVWQWKTFQDPDSPDIEVGIFAMKRSDVARAMEHFESVSMPVDIVQMSPLALYNFLRYDGQVSPEGATLLADVGADKTDLVVSDGSRLWTRTLQIGGKNFTEALVRAFKLSFPKAEQLKTTAATSKYARQIFQSMRPVFSDLVQEIQRSIGYYTSLHREARFKRLVGLGNGFRLPGLQKFLEQNLNMPVLRVDAFSKLAPGDSINTPAFAESSLGLGVAYGLALQALGRGSIETNLLPPEVARGRLWSRKRPWFAAAGVALLLGLGTLVMSSMSAASALQGSDAQAGLIEARRVADELDQRERESGQLDLQRQQAAERPKKYEKLFENRTFWPMLLSLVTRTVSGVGDDQDLLSNYYAARTDAERADRLGKIKAKPRAERKYFIIESVKVDFFPSIADAPFEGAPPSAGAVLQQQRKPGLRVTITGRTPMNQALANERLAALNRRCDDEIKKLADAPFALIGSHAKLLPRENPAAAPDGEAAGPVGAGEIPGESWNDDTRFVVGWKLVQNPPAPVKN
jgi:type IV pilus assembly protein PilM